MPATGIRIRVTTVRIQASSSTPRGAVVVGAAIEFLARHGWLPHFNFLMDEKAENNSYYWGVMKDASASIQDEQILFVQFADDAGSHSRSDEVEFRTTGRRVVIGRKMTESEDAQATPVYLIEIDTQQRIGPIDVNLKLQRTPASRGDEEVLELVSVDGDVAGQPAELGENVRFNWRTLADERYYLDTGGLDNIELG